MIGFPKTLTDFSKAIGSYKNQPWQGIFERKVQSYLNNSDFFLEKKEEWKYFPFQKITKKAEVFA